MALSRRRRAESAAALAHLRRDRRMRALVEQVGPPRFHEYSTRDALACLVASIVSQQLSGRAASTIHARLEALAPHPFPDPAWLREVPEEALRGAGLSRAKAAALRDLGHAVQDGRLEVKRLARLGDEAAAAALTSVKGVGPWTAQMVLMFALGRPDVWPTGDVGIRNALARFHRLPEAPDAEETARLGERWRPYRTYAAWYLWQSIDG
jgi:3-methyladenine DNA glycosylase/8-oxoguanine DNA glycosylase